MKNFRKVLALVLVVATLFSFASIAGAKTLADYEDADKVSYEAAVDVLSAIEILNGYEDDTFKPTNNITRAEMAKMIATMANAGADVHELYAAACDFADAKDNWAASYIAYCAQTGIVAGRSTTTFDPYGKVTGIETAKMLLVTLGFSAEKQGYTGSSWKINVLRDAKNVGLLEGFAADYDVDVAITREEAAQMFLNALTTNVIVGVVSDNIITVTNAVYNSWQSATLIDAEKYGFVKMYGNVIVANDLLGEVLYGNRLTIDTGRDCFGRPGTTWTFVDKRGNTVLDGFYVDTPDAVYTTEADIEDAYESVFEVGYTWRLYVDGTWTAATFDKVNNYAHNGVRIEVYVDEAARTLDVIVINPYWGEITSVTDYYNKATYTLSNGKTYTQVMTDAEVGDVVLAHICDKSCGTKTVHDVTIVEPVTASVEYVNFSTSNEQCDYYFVAGKEYSYTYGATNLTHADATGNVSKDLYLDEYGYVFYTKNTPDAATEYKYAYVIEGTMKWTGKTETLGTDGSWKINNLYVADIAPYGAAGAVTVVDDMGMDDDVKVTGTSYSIKELLETYGKNWDKTGALVQYVENSAGELQMTAWADHAPAGTVVAEGANVIKAGALYADKDTQFMIRTTDPAGIAADTYEIVIGYQNLTETYVAKTLANGYSSIQYIDADNDKIVEYVFIDAAYARVESTFMLLEKIYDASSYTLPGYANYDAYRALVEGVESIVLIDENTSDVKLNALYVGGDLVRGADTRYDGENLPLYVAVDMSGNKLGNVATKVFITDINIDSTGEYQIWMTVNGEETYAICAEGFEVFYIGTGDDGYIKTVDSIYAELLNLIANGQNFGGYYVMEDGKITALYVYDYTVE